MHHFTGKTEDRIGRAQRAAQSGILPLMQEQEDAVLARLVASFRAGTLRPRDALAGIAVLAELRLIENKAIRAVADGEFAVKQEMKHAAR